MSLLKVMFLACLQSVRTLMPAQAVLQTRIVYSQEIAACTVATKRLEFCFDRSEYLHFREYQSFALSLAWPPSSTQSKVFRVEFLQERVFVGSRSKDVTFDPKQGDNAIVGTKA